MAALRIRPPSTDATEPTGSPGSRLGGSWPPALVGVAVAVAIVAPLTRRGWLLLLDWTPGPAGIGSLGGDALPSGPAFLLPARALHVLFGAAVGWLPVAVAVAAAAAGAARLVGDPLPARITAGVAYAANPFVYDRIYAGQVSVLAGYAVLPWLLRAALDARTPGGTARVGLWWALAASCTVHFAWIGGALVLAAALARGPSLGLRRAASGALLATAIAAAVVAAWLLPVAGDAPRGGDARVLDTFATRADPELGRSLGLLAQQGFWRPAPELPRDDLGSWFPLVAGLSLAVAATGLLRARRTSTAPLAGSVTIAAGAGWLLAHGTAGPAGRLYRWAWDAVPGFAVMREAQKWAALVALAVAVGSGLFARMLADAGARRSAWVVVVAPLLLAPTILWGLSGRIAPVHYPEAWAAARDELRARAVGDVAVVPGEAYVRLALTDPRVVANPAPEFFGSHAIVSSDAEVAGLPGDRGRRADLARALDAARRDADGRQPLRLSGDLERLGFDGVLVLEADDGLGLPGDAGLTRVFTQGGLELWLRSPSAGGETLGG